MVKRSWGEVLAGLSPKGSVNKPAGIRSLVYGRVKGKVGIEGLSVSTYLVDTGFWTRSGSIQGAGLDQAEREGLFGRFFSITDRQGLIDPHRFMANRGD